MDRYIIETKTNKQIVDKTSLLYWLKFASEEEQKVLNATKDNPYIFMDNKIYKME